MLQDTNASGIYTTNGALYKVLNFGNAPGIMFLLFPYFLFSLKKSSLKMRSALPFSLDEDVYTFLTLF